MRGAERLLAEGRCRRVPGSVQPGLVRPEDGRADVLPDRLGGAEQGSGPRGVARGRFHRGEFLEHLRDRAALADRLGQVEAAQVELRGGGVVLAPRRDQAEVAKRHDRQPPVAQLLAQLQRLLVQPGRAVQVACLVGDQAEVGQRA